MTESQQNPDASVDRDGQPESNQTPVDQDRDLRDPSPGLNPVEQPGIPDEPAGPAEGGD